MNLVRQYTLLKMLRNLLKKGYPILDALMFLESIEPKLMKVMILEMEKGQSLAQILKQLHFTHFVYETVEIGQQSQQLVDSLDLIIEYFDFHFSMKKEMQKVLLYPIIIYLIALMCFEWIRIRLYPTILQFVSEFQIQTDQPQSMIAFHLLKGIGLMVLISLLLVRCFPQLFNGLKIVPIYRSIYFSQQFKLLLQSGISLADALSILKTKLNQRIYPIKELEQQLLFNTPKKKLSSFSPAFIKSCYIGLQTNNLDQLITDFYAIYFDLFKSKLMKYGYLMQTVIFLVVAINIFLIYYIILMPMYQISNYL